MRGLVIIYQQRVMCNPIKILISLLFGMLAHSSINAKSGSIELSYGRVQLNFNSSDSDIVQNKPFIDSLFRIAERNYHELEGLLGYKSSLQFTATVYNDINDYHEALKLNAVWLERISGTVKYSQEYNYPIYANCNYDLIRSQFIYSLSHFVFHEFLLGISVRQKLSQTGSHTIPNWFLQGLGAYLASGWNANSADEYAFYECKGGFKSPNQIVPMGAQVYGKKIWRDLFQTYGKSVVSTMMFVLKYTGNAESAIEYVTGKSFDVWDKERLSGQNQPLGTPINTEIDLPLKYRSIPIKKIVKHSEKLAIQWYTPGLFKVSIYNSISKKLYDVISYEYPALLDELNFQPIHLMGFIVNEKSSQSQPHSAFDWLSMEFVVDRHRTLVYIDSAGKRRYSEDLGEVKIERSLMERLDIAHQQNDSIYYAIDIMKIEKDRWVMLFNQLMGNGTKTLRVDTLTEKPIVRGLVIEGQGQLSYVQSEGEVWRLRFYHFKDNSDYRWQSEVKNSFYTQSSAGGLENIIESSFGSSLSSVRLLDPAKETVRELELLAKNDSIDNRKKKEIPNKISIQLLEVDSLQSSWEYLVAFPKRTWTSSLNNDKTLHYSGKYDSSKGRNSFYLSQGGLYFGNADYPLPYLNEIKQYFLYNQPFTPEMRFYLIDKNHNYRMSFGILSNLALNRLGLRMQQTVNLGKYQIDQQLLTRSRTFYLNEMSLKKNATNFFSVSIRRNWISNFGLSSGIQIMDDLYFDKIVNPGFSSFKNYRFKTAGLVFGLDWNNRQRSMRLENVWLISLKSSIKINQVSTAKEIPNRVYVNGNSMGTSYLFHLDLNVDKQLVRGVYFKSNIMANKSAGNALTLFWVGGSEGWISRDMWQADISKEYSNTKYLYRANGGFVRGFLSGERIGTGSLSIQNEILTQPFKQFGQKIIKQHFYESLTLYGFLDIGTAFIGNSPANPMNPFNTVVVTTPNYWMSITSKRNPYLVGTGLGVSANVLRTPIRYELAFGLKEGKLMSPIQQVCMSWFF
ncbi:MAG: hypothetical protein RL411_1834 [Bacteroidota bacterium]